MGAQPAWHALPKVHMVLHHVLHKSRATLLLSPAHADGAAENAGEKPRVGAVETG